jgi:hypothetical protein
LLRLPEKQKTRLEKFLLLFNQAWSTDRGYILDLPTVPEEFADIAQYLQGPLMDEDFRRHLVAEEREQLMAINFARQLKKYGASLTDIAHQTGLKIEDVGKLEQ